MQNLTIVSGKKLDQGNNPVPEDLVFLDSAWLDFLKDTEIWAINQLDWYVPESMAFRHIICVSMDKLEKVIEGLVDFTTPEEMGISNNNWLKVDQVLHRWNETDGFYTA